jgi:hypothetical protein
MQPATKAIGRPLPPPGRTAACVPVALLPAAFSRISNRNKIAFKNPRNPLKIKVAPLSNRNTNPVSAPPPQPAVSVLADRLVRIPADRAGHQPASPAGGSPLTNRAISNRQPLRLEIIVSRTKRTRQIRLNRQLFSTFARSSQASRTVVFASRGIQITNLPRRQAGHETQTTNYAACVPVGFAGRPISNRHSVRLENAISCRQQTTASRSNRHFFHVFRRQVPLASPRIHGSRVANHGFTSHHSPRSNAILKPAPQIPEQRQ